MKIEILFVWFASFAVILVTGCGKSPVKWEYHVERVGDNQAWAESLALREFDAGKISREKLTTRLEGAKTVTGNFDWLTISPIQNEDDTLLNQKGKSGWELASAQMEHDGRHMILIFKRPIK